jgi:CRISPR-associated protein Cmr4
VNNGINTEASFKSYLFTGIALDPIHVGTGGTRLGWVDNTIVRDPVTRVPKIPGSSLAGVMRTYVAMQQEDEHPGRKIRNKDQEIEKPFYPDCAGQGGGKNGHCDRMDCPVCTVFGFANGLDAVGGFAGLASFSDMQVLLFPVATQEGPQWITSPMVLRFSGIGLSEKIQDNIIYRKEKIDALNLGWLYLSVETPSGWCIANLFNGCSIPKDITDNICIVSDKLFSHIVNSNLEVRTSVAINPATGAADDGALFTYEALPRGTVFSWELTCRNPKHFYIPVKEQKSNNKSNITAVDSPEAVKNVVTGADSYLEHLGIGGMSSRGMGRLRVLSSIDKQDEVKEER